MKNAAIFLISIIFGLACLGINPKREYLITPEEYHLQYKSFFLKTDDGLKIKSWYIKSSDSISKKTSIIISYGNSGNMSNWLNLSAALVKEGFDVWLYDYRGFGESSDFKMDADQLYYSEFLLDLIPVVDMVKKTNSQNKICLLGMSTGSIISMMYLQKYQNNIDFYIGESHFYSPEIVIRRLQEADSAAFLPKNAVSAETLYKDITIPFMVFQCSEDTVCLVKDLMELRKDLPYVKIKFFKGNHLQAYYLSRDEYIKAIKQFLLE